MNITIISVGKLKEKYLKLAIEEYSKRLQRYCKLYIIELNDEKTPDNASEKEEEQIKDNSYVIALDLKGKMLSSEEFASFIQDSTVRGISSFTFVICGSLGISREVLSRADYKLCFSKITFPHMLFRVMLLEQIYRGYRIIKGEPYHK